MLRKYAVGVFVWAFFPLFASVAQDTPEAATPETSADSGFEDLLLEDEEFALEEGVWSDEFEDGRPSNAWFPYDPGYYAAINVASPRDPRIPHEEATIYDEPINAEEIEGLLSIKGNLPPPGAAPEAASVYDPQDLRRYKVITTDPVRGEFRADLKIALRGRTFGIAQINFFVREHDWKFDGAREARMVIYLINPVDEQGAPMLTQVGYEANWNQAEYFNPLYRFLDLEAEDSVTVQLRRTEDNQIQLWTAEDDADLEFRARLGAPIETELADIVIGIQSTGLGTPDQPEGTVTIDSFSVRGPEVPDVEEGTEDQALVDLRVSLIHEYELDVGGRFEYSQAALAANRAYTWMHYYGTRLPYPKILLPGIPQQGAGAPQQNLQVEILNLRATKTGTLGTVLEDYFDSQPIGQPPLGFFRGDRGYIDMAYAKYNQAAQMPGGSPYSNIASQVEWLHDVALERIIRIMMVLRGRASEAVIRGGGIIQEGFVSRKIDLDSDAGAEPQHSQYDPRIRIFEGRLSPDAKSEALAVPESFALQTLVNYFGPEAEIQRPVDLIARIPFLFDPQWMTIPLTIYVPDISQEVLQRLGVFTGPFAGSGLGASGVTQGLPGARAGLVNQVASGAQFGTVGQISGLTGGGGPNLAGFQALDPSLLIGRGYAVVEYYGARYGIDEQVVRDELGRIDPKLTAERAFPELRDFPGFTDIVTEILDPDQHGPAILEWDFNFADLAQILTVPRSARVPADKLPPPDTQSLYFEAETPILVNQDNPEASRRYTFADYFGWDLGVEGTFREPDRQGNRLAAFDSAPLPLGTDSGQ